MLLIDLSTELYISLVKVLHRSLRFRSVREAFKLTSIKIISRHQQHKALKQHKALYTW